MVWKFTIFLNREFCADDRLSVFTEMQTQPSVSFTICDSGVFHLHLLITLLQVMSERDLLKKSLASHRATTKSEKRKSRAQEEGRGTGVKLIRNYFSDFGGRVRRKNQDQYGNDEPASIQPGGSEIIPLDASIGVGDFLNSLDLEQDVIEERRNKFKKKKREANQETEWKSRMKDKEDAREAWDYKRDMVFVHYIRIHSFTERQCCSCKKITSYPVPCFTCKQDLCSRCDFITHSKLVLHNREICLNGEDKRFLQQSEFLFDDEETITEKEVSVSLLVPSCQYCKRTSTSTTKPGSRDVAVITADGRWDMKSTVVECSAFSYWFEAKGDDYFAYGFHPSSAIDETSFDLICTELLEWCWHFQHKMPGISLNKVIETIQELSETHNRVSYNSWFCHFI
ncbi:hypothetical protein OUZ56_012517 [Daphnia magna]|uniref:CxC3 like cysteine cluster domain-containing protein n=1 Tax=Daphnia magna TaxID=35525 RepID=A0ABQ9Z387_9CRUS|nr:hypothetical protein OUZ56_012517 [Daphnia magna]